MPAWIRSRMRALFHKTQMEHELNDELCFHLEKDVERNIASGMSEEEARLAALRAFGGVEQLKEQCRDARGGDPDIVGRRLHLGEGKSFVVIGVTNRDFVGLQWRTPDIWLPLTVRGEVPAWYLIVHPKNGDWFGTRDKWLYPSSSNWSNSS